MPNIKSSKKDVISSKIAYEKNKADKSELKTNLKKFEAAVEGGDKKEMLFAFRRTGVTPRMLRRSRRCTWCDNRGRRTTFRRSLRSYRPGR